MKKQTDTELQTFLEVLLTETPPGTEYVYCALSKPSPKGAGWPPITEQIMRSRLPGTNKTFYISTMIAKENEAGNYRNKQADFYALNIVVLDDIGTKVDPNKLKPTYRIETSKGNYQWGYVLKEPLTDHDLAERLVKAVYETELSDGGGKMVNKFVRLPAGINGKMRGGVLDTFKVKLIELNPDCKYTANELIEGFGITLIEPSHKNPRSGHTQSKDSRSRCILDPVLPWLEGKGLLRNSSGCGDFINIRCPWYARHTDVNDVAGYSPLGQGDNPDCRSFNCFHDHCSNFKTSDFLDWIELENGPSVKAFDPIPVLIVRYALLEHSSEVADTWASAEQPYPIVSLASFRAAHRQWIQGKRGGKQFYSELWLEHPETVRCKGRIYQPGDTPIVDIKGTPHFNTYRRIEHAKVSGVPTVFLQHIDWLIPAENERELFHNWIAKKLQEPASRSYALVLVAALLEGETGQRYGTGRSTVGDILGRVFQAGVAKVDLGEITGTGDSQAAYNDWADGAQLCIVEETREESASWRSDHAAYEGLKSVIDTRPVPGVRVKPKYGKIYTTTLYCNFLFFTNHSDALQLPSDDRRFYVIDNAKGRRTLEEYAGLHKFLNNDNDIAQLYWWYMERDVSGFEYIYPPMTPAKQRMTRSSISAMDEVWEAAVKLLPGALVTQAVLIRACEIACDGDMELQYSVKKMVRAKWRNLDVVCPAWELKINNKKFKPRIIREAQLVKEAYSQSDFNALRGMLEENLDVVGLGEKAGYDTFLSR